MALLFLMYRIFYAQDLRLSYNDVSDMDARVSHIQPFLYKPGILS